MSKKIIAILITALMIGFAGGSAIASDVTTAYIELGGTSVQSLVGGVIRARLTLLDAAGGLATTIDGSPVSEAIVAIESLNYPTTVGFGDLKAIQADTALTPVTGVYKPSLTDDSIEFGINYPGYPTTLILGSDIIKVSVKKGTTTLVTQQSTINVTAPTANCYVVRTGGVGTLPNVLDELPGPQNDKGALRPAGDSVAIDVFAAYGRDTDSDTFYDKFFFTKTIPAGADTVSVAGVSYPGNVSIISAPGVALVDGHAALTSQVKDLKIPSVLNGATDTANAKSILDTINNTGLLIAFRVTSSVTRAIGGKSVDVDPLITDGALKIFRDQRLGYNGLSQAPVNSAPITSAPQSYRDTCKFQPATFNKLSIVALPVNGITTTAGIYNFFGANPDQTSPMDAFNMVVNPTQSKPTGNKYTARGYGGYCIGAILGWDTYGNPAPFKTGTAVGFKFVGSVSTIAETVWDTIDSSFNTPGAATAGVITATAYQPFLPFKVTSDATGAAAGAGVKVSLDATYKGTPAAIQTALSIIDDPSKGVTFAVKNDKQLGNDLVGPTAVGMTNAGTIDGGKAADIRFDITANGFNGDAIVMRALCNTTGTKVKVGPERTSAPQDTVTITQDSRNSNLAKESITFFTSLDAAGAGQNKLTMVVETGNGVTFIPFNPAVTPFLLTTGIKPADSRDFPPTAVIASISTAGVSQDNGRGHDEIDIQNIAGPPPKLSIIIIDAFGNAYAGGVTGAELATLEDASPTVTILKEDGTTPFPSATGDTNKNNIVANIRPVNVSPTAQKAIVKIAAGAGTGNVTLNLKALQQTVLKNLYVPIAKLDTPVKVNFGDQNGTLIAPDYKNSTTPGSFNVDQEIKDGLFTSALANPLALTTLVPSFTYNVKPSSGKTSLTIAADGGDADASKTTLTLTYAPIDTIPPVIGAVTSSACSVSVAFTDNVALNLAGSTVKVLDTTGKDITSTLPAPTLTGDGTAAGSITFTGTQIGLYTLDIAVKDTSGNITAGQKPANVTTCAVAACQGVNPAYSVKGNTLDVTITGQNTNFGATSVVTFSNADIIVNSATASSATEIVANITISATATAATSDVTVTTGVETVTCSQAFEIRESVTIPSCVSVSPSTVNAGDTTDVTITLQDVDLTKVKGPLSVSFGCTGVSVTSTTVNVISATQAKVSIAVAETAQNCTGDVTITGAADVGVVCKGVFTVKAAPPLVCSLTISPSPFSNGIILPRIRRFTITGTNSAWTSSSTVTIQGINLIIPLSRTASSITVLAIVPSKIRLAAGNKTVTVTTGTVVCTGTLVIQ